MVLNYKIIGARIRTRRKAMHWTQEQLAERIDRSFTFVGHIERGTRAMSLETFFEIVRALDCSADELLGLELKNPDAYNTAIDLLQMAQSLARQKARKH